MFCKSLYFWIFMFFSPWWEKNEKNQDQIKLTNSPLQQSSMYHYEIINLLSTIVPPPIWSVHRTFLLRKNNVGYTNHLFILPAFTSGDWDPLGEDCDFQQKLIETNNNEYSVLSCILKHTKQLSECFLLLRNRAISG